MEGFRRKAIKTLLLILAWYVLSTGLSLYNKQLVGKQHGLFGKGAFPAPLLMSSVQFICQTLLAKLVFFLGLSQRTNSRRMPWSEYLRLVVPNGVTTGLDIGFSNKSLVFINLSFYTMCKSTVPVFLLFFAFVWGIEKPNLELLGVVLVIVCGLVLLVAGETRFDMLGFGLVMTASCLSGLRFTLTQVLLHGHSSSAALGGPLEVLELLTPIMSVTVLLFSIAWEELWAVLPGSPYFDTIEHTALTLLVVAVGALIAFLMVWTEYQVIKETSALTFMIAGTVKEVVTVTAAVLILGDRFTVINGMGLVVVILGVLLFNLYKYRQLKASSPHPRRKLRQGGPDTTAYTSLELNKADDSPGEHESKHRRHYNVGRGSVGGTVGGTTSPGSGAAAVVASVVAAAGGAGGGGGAGIMHHTSHHAASGLLGRALAGVMARGGGGATAGATSIELSPLIASAIENGAGGGGSGHESGGVPAASAGYTGSDRRESDVEGLVVGLGSTLDNPAAAISLSGAGISGPSRSQRIVRGLTTDEEQPLLPPLPPGVSGQHR